MTHAFYLPLGSGTDDDGPYEDVQPTPWTASVWSDDLQHGSPPAALLTRAIEALVPDGMQVVRIVFDLVGAITLSPGRVRAKVTRPGRRVCQIVAELSEGGRVVGRMSAWVLAVSDTAVVGVDPLAPLPWRDDAPPMDWSDVDWKSPTGYISTIESRAVGEPRDRRRCWLRQPTPLFADETPSPLTRLMATVDTANGIAARVDPRRASFMNVDLTVHLSRQPRGDWIGFDAEQSIGPTGHGVTQAQLHDAKGPIGRVAQSLFVAAW